MKIVLMGITVLVLFITTSVAYIDKTPSADVNITNSTGATLTVWAEYYPDLERDIKDYHPDNFSEIIRTESTQRYDLLPGEVHKFNLPVGLITVHAEAKKTGYTVIPKIKTSFKINHPGKGKIPAAADWEITKEDFGLSEMSDYGSKKEPSKQRFNGVWDCDKAILYISQKGNTLTGETKGDSNRHGWGKGRVAGSISGEVKGPEGDMADIYINFTDGYYVRGKGFRVSKDRMYMSGLDPVFNDKGKYVVGGDVALRCDRVK